MRLKNLVVAILLGTALAGGIFLAVQRSEVPVDYQVATVLPATATLPSFNLLDQQGRTVTENVFEGQWDLVFFGFTHCPDICPLTLQTLSAARRQLADTGQDELPRVVLVSVDPERDSVERMSDYMSAFGTDNLGLTGDLAEIRKLTEALGIYFAKSNDSAGENYNVDHSAAVIVLDPAGLFRALFGAPHKVEPLVHDLQLLMQQ